MSRAKTIFWLYILIGALLAVNFGIANGNSKNLSSKAIVVTVVPGAPTNLSAVAPVSTQANLSWSDNSSNETGFSIERKTGAFGAYGEIYQPGANTANYSDNTVLPSTTYFYRVRAFNASGYSDYSNEAPVVTPATGGGGGGGGGGIYIPPTFTTNATFRGLAYPTSDVTLLKDAQVVATTKAGSGIRVNNGRDNIRFLTCFIWKAPGRSRASCQGRRAKEIGS